MGEAATVEELRPRYPRRRCEEVALQLTGDAVRQARTVRRFRARPQCILDCRKKIAAPIGRKRRGKGKHNLLNKIAEEDAALAQGTATFARLVTRGGSEVFSCDVGDMTSDAVIKLSTTVINQGGPVRIDSFRLAMP
jgi:hypothetical protein